MVNGMNQIIGLDVSLNHLGMCSLRSNGELQHWAFLTDIKKFVTEDPIHGHLYKEVSARSDHSRHFRRIRHFTDFVLDHLKVWKEGDSQIVCIEGYALNSKNTRLYETAELIGAIKRDCVTYGCRLRVHDPDTIKMYACNNGHATKDQIYARFMDETGVSLPTTTLRQENKSILSGPGTDVADSYFLARMGWMEQAIRTNQLRLQDLPPHLARIFVRETKAYPINLLERPYADLIESAANDA